jgi:hypothetical protein
MPCLFCTTNSFRSISAAMAKSASARLRDLGAARVAPDWPAREQICARCPMHVLHRGIAYCGTPFLQKIDRDPATDGCGCPIRDKARSPGEHCPVTVRHQPSTPGAPCDCKWCANELMRASRRHPQAAEQDAAK